MRDDERKNQGSAASPPKLNLNKRLEELYDRVEKHARLRWVAWLQRPKIHTAMFQDPPMGPDGSCKGKELAKLFGWSDERINSFEKAVLAYGEEPSVEKYVRIRNEFPEVEIQVGQFGGLEPLFAIQQEIEREGIDPQLVAASLDANEPSIDDLSLHLLQLLVARGRLAQAGPGHIETRRNAISDATVNYLIVTMLEALDWNGECISFPASLIVLIKEQLCGSNPDLYQKYRARERFVHGASLAGQYFHLTKKRLSVRELAAMAGVGRGTAARWLEDASLVSASQPFALVPRGERLR